MAFELARKGCSVLLISRTLAKLEETKTELSAKYPKVQVEILDIDFSKYDDKCKTRIAAAIAGKDVGVLINNVGISYPFTKYFHELEDVNVEQLMTLNVNSTTNMTRLVLPGMVERKRGAIVNIGSAAGVTNSPLLAQYGAAKSYIAMFSKVLNSEYGPKGIDVQCQVPLFVATKLAKLKKTSLFVASPAAYARAAVACIGYDDLISPYWSHALQLWLLAALPERISTAITFSIHQDIRRRGMKKEAEKAKQN
jgi:17beta-estradiol 17-dehydrogenase / very-long-chain 3-oxoacyl-CoA reductase